MFHDNLYLLILFSLFSVTGIIQLFYYLYYYLAVIKYKHPDVKSVNKPVSVIICARDESENLTKFLPSVLKQDYPDYEVIVVNDCSTDNSYEILCDFQKQYPHLRISDVKKDSKFTHTKKFAQFIGIKAAKNDILIFTDADCQPESDKWLKTIASRFNKNIDFVLGYGGYFKRRGLLNKYIRYDSMTIALQYLGMAIRGVPYMGVGRNLAYKRSLFFERKGFGTHSHVVSGDDDLFVNSNADRNNTTAEFRREAHTRSVPSASFGEWIKQKKRHMMTARYYNPGDKFRLITEPFTRVLFYVSFIILLSSLFLWQYVLSILGLRLIIQTIVISLTQKRLNERGFAVFSLFFDIFSPVINIAIYISNIFTRPAKNTWK